MTARGVPVASDGDVPDALGLTREALTRAGFDGSVGSTLVIPGDIVIVAVGIGAAGTLDAAALRNAGAAFARAAGSHSHLAVDLDGTHAVPADVAAQSLVEGVLLRALPLRPAPQRRRQQAGGRVGHGDQLDRRRRRRRARRRGGPHLCRRHATRARPRQHAPQPPQCDRPRPAGDRARPRHVG